MTNDKHLICLHDRIFFSSYMVLDTHDNLFEKLINKYYSGYIKCTKKIIVPIDYPINTSFTVSIIKIPKFRKKLLERILNILDDELTEKYNEYYNNMKDIVYMIVTEYLLNNN